MPVLNDDTKKDANRRTTIIRRRAQPVVSAQPQTQPQSPIQSKAKKSLETAEAGAKREKAETGKTAAAAGAAVHAVEEARPTTPTSPYQARILSKPAPAPKGLPKQDLTEDGIAKDLVEATLVPQKTDAKPATAEDESRKPGKRRHEVSRKLLQEERDSFGRMARLKQKKKKTSQNEVKQTEITTPRAIKRIIKMADHITVGDLAKRMSIKASDVVKKLFDMGMMVTVNQTVDFETAVLLCTDFSFEVQQTGFEEESLFETTDDKPEDQMLRAPIVTVMGHVDHGKTTLLDTIRKSDVAGAEAGGITQHIGAYEVHLENGRKVTFLDTPGHAAFTAMRARGAKITDIIILVVAADDGIMPQTVEAISHARAANVPIIVAINKIDKPGADPERVKKMLTEHELVPEEWGGTTLVVPVSAKSGQGVSHLLESLALQSEIMELKANPNKRASGIVIEARLEKGRGPVSTALIIDGKLELGDAVVAGQHYGRVRAMIDYLGKPVTSAGPATPVEIQGLDGVPEAGDKLMVVKDEKEAKLIAEHRQRKIRETELLKTGKITLDQMFAKIQEGEVKELKVIIKADVQGSAEALASALKELSTPAIKVNVLHSGAGAITETDVNLAKASDSILLGFNIRPEPKARALAEVSGVELRAYTIIYEVIDQIKALMAGKLSPTLKETVIGRADVRETFRVSKVGTIAGCMVTEGKIARSARIRVLRDSVAMYNGKILNLKRFKDDAREVAQGLECGIAIENFNDIQVGDVLEAYTIEEIAATL